MPTVSYTPPMFSTARKLITAILVSLAVIHLYGLPEALAASQSYYVNPTGSDTNTGTDNTHPFKTIQKAVDLAQPGDNILLSPGNYLQDIVSKRNGQDLSPITIKGLSTAVVKGGGNARIIEINHDFITLDGFTVDGLFGSSGSQSGYRDKLIYFLGKDKLAGVTGARVLNMTLKNAGGECMRFRYFATKNEVASNTVTNCGVYDFKFNAGGKNGEGVYIGTAPEQLTDGKNPTSDRAQSNDNWIHNNTFNTQGNECVDIKEASSGNIIENNKCTGQKDHNSAGLDTRGSKNIFRSNETYGNTGAGIRLGGDATSDGTGNHIYNNKISNNTAGGIKFQRSPQGEICGNSFSGNSSGNSVGSYGSDYNPTSVCTAGIGSLPLTPYPITITPILTPIPLPPDTTTLPLPTPSATPATDSNAALKIFIQQLIVYLQNYLNTLP